jgi:LysM repeat protein
LRARAAEDDSEIEDYEGEAEPNMRFSHALFVVLILHVIAVGGVFAFNSIKARQTAENSRKAPAVTEPATQPASTSATPAAEPVAKTEAPKTTAARTHTVVAGETLGKIASLHKTSVEALEEANGITSLSVIRVGQVLVIPDAGAKAVSKKPEPATKPAASASKPTVPAKGIISSVPKPVTTTPAKTQAEPPAAKSEPVAEKSSDGTYTVVKGDNPYSIAKKFQVSYKSLLEVNGIEDPTKIQIGQKLKIPNTGG